MSVHQEGASPPPITLPNDVPVILRGFDGELGSVLGDLLAEISRYIDLSGLDGLTLAADYHQALLDLDRGYKTDYRLTPTENAYATGIAMTPAVLRGGIVKSHIVLSSVFVELLLQKDREMALHVITHECAHVQVTAAFDRRFPGVLLRTRLQDWREGIRNQIAMTCWEEYAACRLSAGWGKIQLANYEETFLKCAAEARAVANGYIKTYRLHGDVGRVLEEVCRAYGELFKYAAYWLGTFHGAASDWRRSSTVAAALENHWLGPHLDRLQAVLSSWFGAGVPSDAAVTDVADLAEQVIAEGGIELTSLPDGQIHAHIPYSPETMPDR